MSPRICGFVILRTFKKSSIAQCPPLECIYITMCAVEGLTLHFIYQRLDYFLKLPVHIPHPLPLPSPAPYPSLPPSPPPVWAQAKHHEFWIWAGGPCSVCVEYLVMKYVWKHIAYIQLASSFHPHARLTWAETETSIIPCRILFIYHVYHDNASSTENES